MKIRMCVTNIDLYGSIVENGIEQMFEKEGKCVFTVTQDGTQQADCELEEVHCLGFCYWCQQGPMAIVNDQLLTKP